MKILLVKMSSMGDVIHAMPVLADILHHFPKAQIDWVVEQGFADLVRAVTPAVRRVIPIRLRAWRKKWMSAQTRLEWRLFKTQLQLESYDLVIDCQGLLKSAIIARMARLTKKGQRVGFDKNSAREPLSSYFYGHKYGVSRMLPAITRNRELCAHALDYSIKDALPQVNEFAIDSYALTRDDWRNPTVPYVVLIPNASRVEKRWLETNWQAIAMQCHEAGLSTVWFWGGNDERMYTENLIQGLDSGTQINAYLPPFLSIPEAAVCLSQAYCVVGLDSGLTHLAAMLNRPTLGIFCDHDPSLAPITAHAQGEKHVASLGGVGTPPSLESVQQVLRQWLPI